MCYLLLPKSLKHDVQFGQFAWYFLSEVLTRSLHKFAPLQRRKPNLPSKSNHHGTEQELLLQQERLEGTKNLYAKTSGLDVRSFPVVSQSVS